jgi:hypothetical protein
MPMLEWTIDRKISLGLIAIILVQLMTFIWSYSRLIERVSANNDRLCKVEEVIASRQNIYTILATQETRLVHISERLGSLSTKLDEVAKDQWSLLKTEIQQNRAIIKKAPRDD